MTHAFNRMRTATLTTEGERTATINDLWFDEDTGAVHHIRVDLGGWLTSDEALIGVRHLAAPETADGAWDLDMTQTQLDAAPRWPDAAQTAMADWPPIIIGPFGNALSLPLVGAQLTAARGPSETGDSAAPRLTQALSSATEFLSQPVFARDGELGTVEDVWVDCDAWSVHALDVSTDDPSKPVRVPYSALRHRGSAAGHIVIAGVRADYSDIHKQAS
ncbi:MAG: PRC-barrel domain-containing protein [Pseudomonadota bacterium]